VIYGAGAVGGVIGARLHEAGREVILIARGAHLAAIEAQGLRFESPGTRVVLRIPAFGHPSEVEFRPDDVIILAMKTQHTAAALDALVSVAPATVSIACAQNGVENERLALRRFLNVYGIMVILPAGHIEPGTVVASSAPTSGVLDCGRYPSGADAQAESIAADLAAAGFSARAVPDVMRWKYGKLLSNLGNAIEALCAGSDSRELRRLAVQEALACYKAADIVWADEREMSERRADHIRLSPDGAARRLGGSSWQSLARGAGSIEADYLNGEVTLLGRLHGVATPVNETLQRLANQAAARGLTPGHLTPDEVIQTAKALA
jgi:2-dehydropantoate 2-reductase